MRSHARYNRAMFVISTLMVVLGLAAATMPLAAQRQEMLCQFLFPGCNENDCQAVYCDTYYPGSIAYCQGPNGECCNCYY